MYDDNQHQWYGLRRCNITSVIFLPKIHTFCLIIWQTQIERHCAKQWPVLIPNIKVMKDQGNLRNSPRLWETTRCDDRMGSWIRFWDEKGALVRGNGERWIRCTASVQFSRSVVSDSLRPHVSQHARPPCPSPTPGVHSDSRPSSQWCHPAISSSVVPFSSCPNPS